MGLPEIRISFAEKASSAVKRGSRGMVAVLLNDTTKDQFLTPYRRWREISREDWSTESLKVLQLAFKGGPQKVLAVRLAKDGEAVDLAGTLADILPLDVDYLVYPGFTAADKETFTDYLSAARKVGKKVKAVLPCCAADDPHVVNFATDSVTALWDDLDATVTYTGAEYCCRIAGILAGLPLTQSCTYYELSEVVDAQLAADPDAAVDAGQLVIVFDGDKYKLGRGITSLTTVTADNPEDFKKIKIVEGMDIITHDIYSTFVDTYVGKVTNSYDNKQLFVGAVNDYLRQMQGAVLDAQADNRVEVDTEANRDYLESRGTDTADMSDQELKEANTGSFMYLTGSCRMLDAAEDLVLQMYM